MSPRLLVTTSTYPRWPGDSHPAFVHHLCARLVDRHDVEAVVLAPASHGAVRHEVVDGVRVKRFDYWRDRPDLLRDGPALPTLKAHPTTALQVPTYLAAMARAVRRELRRGRFDAVHAHWVVPQATVVELATSRDRRPRLVGTSHGSDVLALGRAGEPLLRWTLERLDAFTGVSRAVVDRARELGLPTHVPATVAPMGVDTEAFRPDEGLRAAKRADLGVDGPLVLCVSRLVRGKGVDVLLDALPTVVADHPGVRVAIVGHGQERRALEEQRDRLGLREVVAFHGHQPLEDLPAWYAAADVHVGASRSEGFGLVHVEALACGCPVLASDLPAVREALLGTVGATFPVDRSDALATALADHLDHRAERRAAAVAGAADVAARFGWDATADRYAEVLFG